MVSSQKKAKTIHSEAREMINHVNHQCKQEAVEKSLILPICRADERTANYYGVSVAAVKHIRQESRRRNYAKLKPYIFDKVHMFPHNVHPHWQGKSFSPE
jgi:methylthioribose-1-phosphate isomerase